MIHVVVQVADNLHNVATYGSDGKRIALAHWPTHDAALAFARRMAKLCGGTVIAEELATV